MSPLRPSLGGRAKPVLRVCALLLAATLGAHDFWIEPSSFRPAPGGLVAVRLKVGAGFQGDPVPRMPELLVRLAAWEGGRAQDLPGRDGSDPAGYLRAAGPALLQYESRPAFASLDGPTFERYLAEEGLEAVAARRAKQGRRGAPARDAYVRCAKALVSVGGRSAPDRPLGMPLELVAGADPAAPGPLPLTLLHRGKPLAGALVVAFPKSDPQRRLALRTDRRGRVSLPLSGPGPWLVKAVHAEPARAGVDADWESWWASLTFERP